MISPTEFVALIVAGLTGLLSPFVIRPMLRRMMVIDIPNERSSHVKPTVRGLGLAQLLAVIVGTTVLLVVLPWAPDGRVVPLVIGGGVAASVLGFADDRSSELSALLRLILQLVIGGLVGVGCVVLFAVSWWFAVVIAIIVCGYINAVNFMDGINGISGLHGLVVGVCFAALGGIAHQHWLTLIGLLIAVAYVVFLPWNFRKPGAFLGDVGSYLLGALIAASAVAAACAGVPVLAVLAPTAIYLTDTTTAVVRRAITGANIFQAHRSHTYQRLIDCGLSHLATSLIVAGFSAVTGALGILLTLGLWPVGWCVAAMVMVCLAYKLLPVVRNGSGWVKRRK